jgi:hypothetical protein
MSATTSSACTAVSDRGRRGFDRLPRSLQESIRGWRGRHPPELHTEAELAALMADSGRFLSNARAPATVNVLCTVFVQWDAWHRKQRDHHPTFGLLPLDETMVLWLVHKMKGTRTMRPLTRSTPYKYCKILHQLYRQMERTDSPALAEMQKALKRGGFHLAEGAPAATLAEVQAFLARRAQPRSMRMQVLAMWLLASRTDDVNRLPARDISTETTADGSPITVVTWTAGTKAGATPLVDVLAVPEAHRREWTAYLNSMQPGEHPFPHNASQVTDAIRTVNPLLSSHSIKKGALTLLANLGLPLAQVALKAKHKSIDLLRQYIGERAVAMGSGAMEIAGILQDQW